MHFHTVLAYSAVACVAVASPGPATVLAMRNSVAYGLRTVVWSSLGNVSGLFLLSAAAMLGLGVLLRSSALLFEAVKIIGALYLFYMGLKHVFGRATVTAQREDDGEASARPQPRKLYLEAVLTAGTNPKPILFFTALFPQFIDADASLLPQFFVLTGIFVTMSFVSLMSYAAVASRARALLARPRFAQWVNRGVGAIFISFGAALLALRRQTS